MTRKERLYHLVCQARFQMEVCRDKLTPSYTREEFRAYTIRLLRWNKLCNAFDNA